MSAACHQGKTNLPPLTRHAKILPKTPSSGPQSRLSPPAQVARTPWPHGVRERKTSTTQKKNATQSLVWQSCLSGRHKTLPCRSEVHVQSRTTGATKTNPPTTIYRENGVKAPERPGTSIGYYLRQERFYSQEREVGARPRSQAQCCRPPLARVSMLAVYLSFHLLVGRKRPKKIWASPAKNDNLTLTQYCSRALKPKNSLAYPHNECRHIAVYMMERWYSRREAHELHAAPTLA